MKPMATKRKKAITLPDVVYRLIGVLIGLVVIATFYSLAVLLDGY